MGCAGAARVEAESGRLRLRFDDGSALDWDASRVAVRVSAPAVQNGDTVWVNFAHDVVVVCPFCGSYYDDSLELRERQEGRLLWVGREGHELDAPEESLLLELFGAPATERLACRHVDREKCTDTTTEVFEQIIETIPEQAVHLDEVAHITANGSTFDVAWAHTETYTLPRPDVCPPPSPVLDGPSPARDRGFAVSRVR